ncbi:hypothetical protein [Aquitalea pelogenes]|uniref:hypothetical protein n=1 Tax=Aquitalea pelogenes TaxID=1293573 RepID=UPI0035B3BE46
MRDELKQLRITTWLNACLEASGCESFGCLYEKTSGVSLSEWSRYKNGYRDSADGADGEKRVYGPSDVTVKNVGRDLPGTAQVFFHGPGALPIWAVLEGDLKKCDEVLNECLLSHKTYAWMVLSKKVVPNMTLKEKCQALLEISIPSSWFEKHTQDVPEDLPEFWWADEDNPPNKIDLRFASSTKIREMYSNLSEMIKKDKNIIALAYSKSNRKKSVILGNTIIKHVGEFKVALPQNIVAFLAAAVLCVTNSKLDGDVELADIAFFFFEGLQEAIKNEFGEEILNYINEFWNL